MISVSKDNQDKVIAYMESRVVGQSGFDKLHGEYIYIADLWIHEDYKCDWSIFRDLMNDILLKAQSARWIYFERKKYGGRMSKLYPKEKIMRLLDRVPMLLIKEMV
jgi:hypothetical protein